MNERLDKAELRVRFRLAIPHAGPDPTYALRPSSRFMQQQKQQQQRVRQEQQSLSLLSPPPSTSSRFSGGFSANAGGPPEDEDEGGEGAGEGYTEPAYITRQRCLVLNDWALSLFERGEYEKVWARKIMYLGRRLTGSVMCFFTCDDEGRRPRHIV